MTSPEWAGPTPGQRRPGSVTSDSGEFTASEPTAKPRALLLGRDGRELPPVPRRDPLAVVAWSVRPRGRRAAEVVLVVGDRFAWSAVVRDTELAETVQSCVMAHALYRGREPELLALLRQRRAIEVSHYMASRTARRRVTP
ncbi:MAG: hypothetical protein IT458_15720 [Planctomycetes bacterium]|nr:hypothetical protein [Planctomycetota bacterium]